MLVYAGIDEAGYGPMLGPLCTACTVFTVAEHDHTAGPPDLWSRLARAVCREKRDRAGRLVIDDSKKLKNTAAETALTHLERGVLAFLASLDNARGLPRNDDELMYQLGIACPDLPWYVDSTALPLHHDPAALAIQVDRLSRACQARGAQCRMMAAAALDAGPFNEAVRRADSKAAVNLSQALRLADEVWKRWPAASPRVVIDRQSGRSRYARDLSCRWPEAEITVIAESERFSRYEIHQNGQSMAISFVTEADSNHLPVALASMTAKYLRELLMARLNRYFCRQLPELKPTAGYMQDGRRYLKEIHGLLNDLGVDRTLLVRDR